MRFVIQRVSSATVEVEEMLVSEIETGLLVLAGIEESDTQEDIDWLVKKTIQLRIFNDSQDVMNLSLQDVDGKILLVSQFTLHASTKKGNRPSYIRAARPETAIPLYEQLIDEFRKTIGHKNVETGIFGADMKVSLLNDGPVTIIMDSKNRDF
jgi:D-aminoacyl-tRNA deacylase